MTTPARASLFALEAAGIKLGLEQIRALLAFLGHPERAYPSVVIAGTNGKGSVTAMVERALREAGYRTGRYTSPHLVDIEERFVVAGQPIDSDMLDFLAARVLRAAERLPAPPSFFEATTAIALEAFRSNAVEAAVLEVGLGGRLDATNAVQSSAVAITSVDFDHQAYLGHTIEEIAREKAGVIKPNGLTVLSENPAPVCRVVLDVATDQAARLVYAPEGVAVRARMVDGKMVATIETPRETYPELTLGLRGRHQVINAVTAIRLLEELNANGSFAVSSASIRAGIEQVVWPARLELIEWRGAQILIDGAHNPAGAQALAFYILEAFDRPVPMVIAMMRDKDVEQAVKALQPAASHFICTAPASPRAATPEGLAALVKRVSPVPVTVATSPRQAVDLALSQGSPVVVAGSLYLAGEIRKQLT